jgi:hypothetical protein
MGREIQMIRAGARQCDQCKHRPSGVATTGDSRLRALCQQCAEENRLERRLEINRNARAAMKARG